MFGVFRPEDSAAVTTSGLEVDMYENEFVVTVLYIISDEKNDVIDEVELRRDIASGTLGIGVIEGC